MAPYPSRTHFSEVWLGVATMRASSFPSSTAAPLGFHPNTQHRRSHSCRCRVGPTPRPTPNPDPQPLKTTTATSTSTSSQSIRRREASVALAGFCLSRLLGPTAFLLTPPAHAAGEPPGSPQCSLAVAPSGLAFCDSVVGTGAEATKGLLINAHYVGRLENGKVFDNSYNRGRPLTFRVGVGEVMM